MKKKERKRRKKGGGEGGDRRDREMETQRFRDLLSFFCSPSFPLL